MLQLTNTNKLLNLILGPKSNYKGPNSSEFLTLILCLPENLEYGVSLCYQSVRQIFQQ